MKFLFYLIAIWAYLAVSTQSQEVPERLDRNSPARSECYQRCSDLWGAARSSCTGKCKAQYPEDIVLKKEATT